MPRHTPDFSIRQDSDAIVKATAICGTDLHLIRGTLSGMKRGTSLGHEGVGVVEEVGKASAILRWATEW